MGIKKQEFYEGAALHLLARAGSVTSVSYQAPFFVFNDRLSVLLKFSTKGRSPWGFTFTPDEQSHLQRRAVGHDVMIGLICGDDGVAAVPYDDYLRVATPNGSTVHVACYRRHGEHYQVKGPEGRLNGKVAPSNWLRILDY